MLTCKRPILNATNEWTSRHCLAAWMLAMEARNCAVCKDNRWMNGLTVPLLAKSMNISVALRLSSRSWDVISLAWWLDSVQGLPEYRNAAQFCAFAPWLGFTRCHTSSRRIDSHLHAGLPSCLDSSCNLQNLKLEQGAMNDSMDVLITLNLIIRLFFDFLVF